MPSAEWNRIKELFSRAVDLDETGRAELLETETDEVKAEVRVLVAAHKNAADFIDKPAAMSFGFDQQGLIGQFIGQYQLVELVGSGGMGTVYKAAKDDFGGNFAVKLIKRGMDTDAVLRRFALERDILARLEHPNISRLIDGGTTADGLPYLVMEFVEGETLLHYCRQRDFDLRSRLELFGKMCAAVSYAHKNLIVHRDLKPSNILVTAEGAPKLLDFGIAKLLDSHEDGSTATGLNGRAFTPDYAAPEHLEGRPVTTAADVYSLGVILYELLTGTRPFRGKRTADGGSSTEPKTDEPIKPSAAARTSAGGAERTTGEFDHSSTNGAVHEGSFKALPDPKLLKGDLDNIVLKALRREPERRYNSVQEFSDDIRRYLEGLPVTATADSATYRLTKFLVRHRRAVVLGAAAILIVMSAIVFAAWQGVKAERERVRAEKRFQEVRKLARLVIFDYQDGIQELVGSTKIRERMIRDSLEYLDSLAQDQPDDSLRAELATAYRRIATLQGNPYSPNLGNFDDAITSYQKAITILESYQANGEQEVQRLKGISDARAGLGDVMWGKGEFAAAIDQYKISIDVYPSVPDDSESFRLDIARREYSIGQALRKMGRFPEALEYFKRVADTYKTVTERDPKDEFAAHSLATAYMKLGDVAYETGDYQTALTEHGASYEILKSIENPATSTIRAIAYSANRIGRDHRAFSNGRAALEHDRKAVDAIGKLSAADSHNQQYSLDLAYMLIGLGASEQMVGNSRAAADAYRRAIEIMKTEIAKSPDNFELTEELKLAEESLNSVLRGK